METTWEAIDFHKQEAKENGFDYLVIGYNINTSDPVVYYCKNVGEALETADDMLLGIIQLEEIINLRGT